MCLLNNVSQEVQNFEKVLFRCNISLFPGSAKWVSLYISISQTVSRGVEARFTQLLFPSWLFHMMKILTTKLWNSAIFLCKWYTLGHQWEKFLFLCILLHMVREIRERRWGTLYYAEFQKKKKIPETWQWKETVITFPTFSFISSFYEKKYIFQEKKVFEELFPSPPKF